MSKHLTLFLSAVLVLAAILAGCSRQGGDDPAMQATSTTSVVPSASVDSTTAPETTDSAIFVPNATAEETVSQETVPQIPAAAEDSGRATVPSSDSEEIPELLDPSIPEDTRPPIEVTLPDETKPYTSFEAYNDMTEAEQKRFYDSFESPDDFFAWYNQAKAEYEEANPPIIIDGSTNIEIIP